MFCPPLVGPPCFSPVGVSWWRDASLWACPLLAAGVLRLPFRAIAWHVSPGPCLAVFMLWHWDSYSFLFHTTPPPTAIFHAFTGRRSMPRFRDACSFLKSLQDSSAVFGLFVFWSSARLFWPRRCTVTDGHYGCLLFKHRFWPKLGLPPDICRCPLPLMPLCRHHLVAQFRRFLFRQSPVAHSAGRVTFSLALHLAAEVFASLSFLSPPTFWSSGPCSFMIAFRLLFPHGGGVLFSSFSPFTIPPRSALFLALSCCGTGGCLFGCSVLTIHTRTAVAASAASPAPHRPFGDTRP